MGSPAHNPMGVEWFGLVMGLGFVLSFGYWCTDFLVVQRAMAADSMNAARRTPLIAALPKMLFPFLVILPGMIAMALPVKTGGTGLRREGRDGSLNYDRTYPADADALLPGGHAGARHERAHGVVHVGHGRQHDGLQHGVDVRHLPELHQAGRKRRALPGDGARGNGLRHPDFSRRSLSLRGSSTTSWTCCSWCSRS